jgi:hypothetical protein
MRFVELASRVERFDAIRARIAKRRERAQWHWKRVGLTDAVADRLIRLDHLQAAVDLHEHQLFN